LKTAGVSQNLKEAEENIMAPEVGLAPFSAVKRPLFMRIPSTIHANLEAHQI
jgi:hypothetical protein